MSMTLLMVLLSAATIYADQTVKVDIKGSDNVEEWSLKVDGTTIVFTDGVASVSGKAGKTAVLSITPNSNYEVFNLYIQETLVFGTRADISVPKISYTQDGNEYTFTMPTDESHGVYISAEIMDYKGITSLSSIIEENGKYVITSDIDATGFSSIESFSGELAAAINPDTNMPYRITGLTAPLFTTLTGTVKNIVLESVNISGHTDNTGAIACTANGAARIYNVGILSGSVGGSGNTGGLVGLLEGTARVINCYSFATITGGSNVGGIVGNNNATTTAASINTMVMNCMFYGDITGGSTVSPIYGGNIISNAGDKGVGNYNYFRLEAPYVQPSGITYNCALGAEDRFLQRFEFYRILLNSHRELAGWWATGTFSNSEMLKWVLETADRTIDNPKPYPILKAQGKYPSIINYDDANAPTLTLVNGKPREDDRNKGGKFGTLTVKIQMGDGAVYKGPSGAAITTQQLSLNITDKDPDHFNFNYYKVQLPYYNDVGTKNYNGNRVVTGWKIVNIEDGTPGTYTASDTWGGYNFADRNCTNKDLYGTGGSNRIFNQGAYWDVPEGVTSITIEPYWAKCVYLADPNADKVYKSDMSGGYDVPNVGGGSIYTNGNSYSIAGENQVVYTSIGNAIASSGSALFAGVDANSHTVYDYAVVLVGNYHHYYTTNKIEASKSKPYTVTSIDLDGDNEPDYSYILRFDGRCETHPVRADFINIPGLGMAQKSTGGTGSYNFGIMIPKGWFESTNTSLFRVTQFEYEHSARSETDAIIVQGGVIEQWVSNNQKGTSNKIPYIHVGGNVWFKEFHTGCHQDKQIATKHSPISVTGGDYDEFYLTGLYRGDVSNKEDNAECYINGGRFGTVCGAAMEGIGKANGNNDTGNITWLIQNADIHEFYAGGLNAAKPVTGNLRTTIVDSHVDIFCGGPKFGDMSASKTVVTNATGCIFGTFFGAGYGGNSYSRYAPANKNNVTNINWNNWLSGEYKQSYNATYGGVSTQFNYQFLPMSDNKTNVARILVDFVKFSLATCCNVTSTLTGCKITGNFYGGGSLGKVDGPVTSTLTNCEVQGSAFGAGFSASLPSVEVDQKSFETEPYYYTELGTYRSGVKGSTTTYTWQKKTGDSWVDNKNHILYTTEDLTTLGTVKGKVTLNIIGTTAVAESVYGGGEESVVDGNTEVTINGGSIGAEGGTSYGYRYGNVYGGGKGKIDNAGNLVVSSVADLDAGLVKGNTSVTINGTTETTKIVHNVYGGGAVGSVGTFTRDANGMPTACTSGGQATVTINGGQVGHNRKDSGMVNGSSRGWEGNPNGEGAFAFLNQLAWVNNGTVIIGDATTNDEDKGPAILGSVYGGGENGHNFKDSNVTINKGTIGNADPSAANYDCGNVYGAGCGTDTYTVGEDPTEHHNPMAGIVRGTTTITVKGGHVLRNVYGGGSMGSVGNAEDPSADNGQTIVTISGGEIGTEGTEGESNDKTGHVFGGPKGNFNDIEVIAGVKKTQVTINGTSHIRGSVFGGGENGIVKGAVAVNVAGGTIDNDVYGGGALAHTNTYNWDDTANDNAGGWAEGKTSASNTTTVSLTGGTINGEAYGGALGQKAGANGESSDVEAFVYGDVKVELNKGIEITGVKGCVVNQIFGCNNLNGTPKGDVEVHVYNTQRAGATQIVNDDNVTNAKVAGTQDDIGDFDLNSFDVAAVYGGGNQADYIPVDGTNQKTYVVIEGCDRTSIGNVYGGGNAAAVPGTHVLIKGSYEIGEVFGGGNGAKEGTRAHVGKYNESEEDYTLGDGKALVQLMAGKVKFVYGGSNTRGNIRGGATVNNVDNEWTEGDQADCCKNMQVGQIFAGGKNADMASGADVILGCTNSNDWVEEIYAGARRANVGGDVSLTITSGKFGRVFGGNMISGKLNGSITVNIEENGVCGIPVIIGELYGGGNLAAYSIYGYNDDGTVKTSGDNPHASPVVNVRAFTSIGNIFGGGYGNSAVMVGSPTVNINEAAINHTDEDVTYDGNQFSGTNLYFVKSVLDLSITSDPTDMTNIYKVVVPDHTDGKMGVIGNIYGGGNAAEVQGDTHVNIGTDTEVYVVRPDLTVTDKVKGFYTRSWDSATKTYDYTLIVDADKTAEEGVNYYQKRDVAGADIRGNVYGGGNKAEVTGSTNVVVGKSN